MTAMTSGQLTEDVLAAYRGTPEPRLRQLLTALIDHLHAFVVQTRLTPAEWQAAIEFLTATGRACDDERQEFILLSDVLGLSSLVDLVNAAPDATESTVLGPFYVPGAPRRAPGEQIGRPETAAPPSSAAGSPTPAAARWPEPRWMSGSAAATGSTTPRIRASRRITCAACSPPGRTADMNSERCALSAIPFRLTGRWVSCCARPGATTGAQRTSTRSSPRPGTAA